MISPYKFTVYGLKKGKREPSVDRNGVVLDDGVNNQILLSGSNDKVAAKMFMENVKKNVGKEWKIWIEET